MILDCALFAGETDMLALRMLTLKDVVDRFVVVACTRTHQGQPADVDGITMAYMSAIWDGGLNVEVSLHWCDPDMTGWPEGVRGGVGTAQYQAIEKQHRDACLDAARAITSDPDAIVCVSDVDELPTPEAVSMFADLPFDECPWFVCEQRFHSTALTLLHPVQPWLGTTVSRLSACEPQAMRDARGTVYDDDPAMGTIVHSGHHLSWMGTDDERRRKIETFSHAELRDQSPADWRARGVHANGEVLIECDFPGELDWPEPLLDGSFRIPASWTPPCLLAQEYVGHDCPNDKPAAPFRFGCFCEYEWCLEHGQQAKRCDGILHPVRASWTRVEAD